MFIGKNVVVTGASKGIGYAISKKFSESGANLFLLASNDSRLSDAARTISSKSGNKVNYFAQDLRSERGCELAYSNVLQVFDGVDILINSAGATFLSNINYLIPVVAFFLGALLLGEEILLQNIVALLFIISGIFISRKNS